MGRSGRGLDPQEQQMSSETTSVGSDLKELSVEVITTVGGIITSLLTVGLNLLLISWMDLDLLSVSVWLVVPVGAGGGGMLAASGYYFAARLTQTMPTQRVLWNMLLVGASTWALVKWIPYMTMTLEDGTAVSDVVSFWEFIKVTAASTELVMGHGRTSTGQLGSLGYAREVLQLIGFSFGGLAAYGWLTQVEACANCRRYAKTETLLKEKSPEALERMLQGAALSLPNLGDEVRAAAGRSVNVRLTLVACRCPMCAAEWIRPSVITGSGQDIKTQALSARFLEPAQAAALRQHAAAPPTGDTKAA
jgi:hypothetical protein